MYTLLNGPSLSSMTFEAHSKLAENGEVDE